MIKVPGTAAGLPAIEELTRRGVNVNITLLFSIERYEQVIDAYLRGLSARADAGEPVDKIASVASFFLSRIDTKADALLDRRLARPRPGRDRQRPRRLPALPGQVRRPGLGAPPRARRPAAAAAVGEHRNQEPRLLRRALRLGADRPRRDQHDARAHAAGVRRPRRGRAHARRQPRCCGTDARRAAAAGLDLAAVTAQLEREGVRSFCDSYHQLLGCIERKLAAVSARPVTHNTAAPVSGNAQPARRPGAGRQRQAPGPAPPSRHAEP